MKNFSLTSVLVSLLLAACCHDQPSQPRSEPWIMWERWGGGMVRTDGGGLYNSAPYQEAMQSYPSREACESARVSIKLNKNWQGPSCLPATMQPAEARR